MISLGQPVELEPCYSSVHNSVVVVLQQSIPKPAFRIFHFTGVHAYYTMTHQTSKDVHITDP